MALLLHLMKTGNKLEEGGRTAAPVQRDEGEPEKLCPNCRRRIPVSRLWGNGMVCDCGYHFHMKARQRIEMLTDSGSFRELFTGIKTADPLLFPGYQEKLETVRTASGEEEAVICGTALVDGHTACLFAMESYFMMGSMGCAVGEKITLLFEHALQNRLPVIGIIVSGGARMQEGVLSLMQMARTSAAVKRHSDAGLLYTALLTDPTTGGRHSELCDGGGCHPGGAGRNDRLCRCKSRGADHQEGPAKRISEGGFRAPARICRLYCTQGKAESFPEQASRPAPAGVNNAPSSGRKAEGKRLKKRTWTRTACPDAGVPYGQRRAETTLERADGGKAFASGRGKGNAFCL